MNDLHCTVNKKYRIPFFYLNKPIFLGFRIKHEGFRYSCDQCDYTTTKIFTLNEHKKASYHFIILWCMSYILYTQYSSYGSSFANFLLNLVICLSQSAVIPTYFFIYPLILCSGKTWRISLLLWSVWFRWQTLREP